MDDLSDVLETSEAECRLGIIRTPEVPANLAFGGSDLKTLFLTARTSVSTLRVKTAGQPHPWYRRRA